MIIICGFVLAGCSAEACGGIGKQSSPQQAFSAAGFPVVAGRVGHDQNDGVGQQFSTTLNPPNTLFIIWLQLTCDLAETKGEMCIKLCCNTWRLLLDFTENRALVAGNPVFSPPRCVFLHLWIYSAWEWVNRGWNMETGLLFEPAVTIFSPLPRWIHMHLVSFADSAVCTTNLPSFAKFVFSLFYKLMFS